MTSKAKPLDVSGRIGPRAWCGIIQVTRGAAPRARPFVFLGLLDNVSLWAAIGLRTAVAYLPVLQIALATSPLCLSQRVICAGVAFLVLWAQRLARVMRRLHSRFCTREIVR